MTSVRSTILAIMVMALCGATAAEATSPPEVPVPGMVGGWSSAEVTPEVRKAARYALRRLKRPGASLREVSHVEKQIVAGINYRITMKLSDGSRWRVVVWQRPDRSYRMTSAQRLKPAKKSVAAFASQLTVTGKATYRQRIALPPDARVLVQLLDVSKADAPATILAEQHIKLMGKQVPIPFELSVASNKLPGPMGNSVSVRIESASGELLWISDTITRVEPDEKGNRVDIGEIVLVKP